MKIKAFIAACAAFGFVAPAVAQDAAAPEAAAAAPAAVDIKAGAVLYSAEGARLAQIERVVADASGKPAFVKIISNGQFRKIPASTISAGEKGLTTSLSKREVNKLK